MTNNRWKMCVVGFVIAWPVVCTATTISDAVAAAGDGKYVQMDYGSSITLAFGTSCSGTDPAVVLSLAEDSGGFYVDFYLGSTFQGTFDALESHVSGPCTVYWEGVPFDSVTIRAYGTVYLDAVQGTVTEGTLVGGNYVSHTGTVTALPDDPAAMVEDLIDLVTSYNLQQGIDNSLDAKLASASDALEDVNANNDAAAVNKLEAFIGEVEAQRGKRITDEQADALGADAQAIIAALTMP
jgi:hypothetical protein